ncbi:hypothetical protein [Fimbriimonas ginsengisoli]|uniref:hypothetical protein n=1 Tax=Fimbriimonas ginsengisoli TaxID=1005039 RepID=UPI00046D5781|nr:hypothetical protein [Fimbriimonas ginsengisoli]
MSDPQPVVSKPKGTMGWLWHLLLLGLCLGVLASIIFPVFASARVAATKTRCLSNLKELAVAQLLYSEDNQEQRLPDANRWMDLTKRYIKSGLSTTYHCPSAPDGEFGYAMSSSLNRKSVTEIESLAKEILIFDSKRTNWNASGDPRRDSTERHGFPNAAYADGHAGRLFLK